MFEFLVNIQRAIRTAIAGNIDAYAQTPNWHILLAMLSMGIVFGVAHAMTPGHSKALLASYVVGGDVKPLRAFATAMTLSVIHIASAVLLAVTANTLITRTLLGQGVRHCCNMSAAAHWCCLVSGCCTAHSRTVCTSQGKDWPWVSWRVLCRVP